MDFGLSGKSMLLIQEPFEHTWQFIHQYWCIMLKEDTLLLTVLGCTLITYGLQTCLSNRVHLMNYFVWDQR